jgi:hypothetical protein
MLRSMLVGTSAGRNENRQDVGQPRSASLLILISLLVLVLLPSVDGWFGLSLVVLSRFTSISVGIVLAAVVYVSSRGWWSVSTIYLSVFTLFHFGIPFVLSLSPTALGAFPAGIEKWFYSPATEEAILVSCLGFTACGLGVGVALRSTARQYSHARRETNINTSLPVMGFVLLVISLSGWFWLVISSGGVALLFSSYEIFLKVTEGTALPFVYYGIGLGLTSLATVPSTRLSRVGFGLFAGWALLAFVLGLRGEVLFPASAAAAVWAKRSVPLSGKKIPVLVCGLLMAIAVVKEVRQVGVHGLEVSALMVNPRDAVVDALVEMGSSLRPVSVVVSWQGTTDDRLYGASYWAPVSRALFWIIPGWSRLEAEDDERILNVVVERRVGPIGFSPVAEAYHNFGRIGVIGVLFLIGFVLGRMDLWPATQFHQALLGVIALPLLIEIRNTFTPVPGQIVVGLVFLYGTLMLSRATQRRNGIRRRQLSQAYAPSPGLF